MGVVFWKKYGVILVKIREYNLEFWFLMNYGIESIFICFRVGGVVVRVFYILNFYLFII